MRTLPRVLALATVSALALTGCVRVEMNVTLGEDDTASGDFVFAVSQELLDIAGEDSIDDLLGAEETIPGGVTERYESPDDNGDGNPDFVGTQTTFEDLPLDEFDAAGDGLRIARDGDDYVVSGAADDLTEQTGGEELPDTATAAISITFPGEVSDHNGELDGTTVTWDLLEHSGELQARGSASSDAGFPLWLIYVLLAIVGVGAGIAGVLIFSSRRKGDNEPQAMAGDPYGDDIPAGSPADSPTFVDPTGDASPAPQPAVNGVPADASAAPESVEEDPVVAPTADDPAVAPTAEAGTTETTGTTEPTEPTEPTVETDGPREDPHRP